MSEQDWKQRLGDRRTEIHSKFTKEFLDEFIFDAEFHTLLMNIIQNEEAVWFAIEHLVKTKKSMYKELENIHLNGIPSMLVTLPEGTAMTSFLAPTWIPISSGRLPKSDKVSQIPVMMSTKLSSYPNLVVHGCYVRIDNKDIGFFRSTVDSVIRVDDVVAWCYAPLENFIE